jgi:hypothetical protein
MTDTRAALADEAVPRLLEALADPIMGRMLRERLAERGVLLVTDDFRGLLDVADHILTNYPPDTIVCSHLYRADVGARTVAAIADLIASCRAVPSAEVTE